jgi:uncharacterized secreted repeat protein (TIGR03808 family)
MPVDRRDFAFGLLGSTAAWAMPLSAYGLDAAQFRVSPNAARDQSRALQAAIDRAAAQRVPLVLAPGVYRAGGLTLPAGAQLIGAAGQTRLVLTQGPALVMAAHGDGVSLTGLTFDGGGQQLPPKRGLLHFTGQRSLTINRCQIANAGGNGLWLEQCDGSVIQSKMTGTTDTALFALDSRGLRLIGNSIAKSGNGGIRVWQSDKRHDGSLIAENTIEDTGARDGGSGQNGNAINIFRAADVVVRDNIIRGAAFSAIRGNAASRIQIVANRCSALDEVAIYSEFEFENALIADNLIDGAATGISVTNFKEGGRGAVVRNNTLRNIRERRPGAPPEEQGIGIAAEADTAVTGNIIDSAQSAGIAAGWGPYLRNVTVTDNTIRDSGIGVAVSVADGAGRATISDNLITGSRRGAILGMEWRKIVSGDLAIDGAGRYPQLTIGGNRIG